MTAWLASLFGVAGASTTLWWQRRRDGAVSHAVAALTGDLRPPVAPTPATPDAAAAPIDGRPLAAHRASGPASSAHGAPTPVPARPRRSHARHAPYTQSELPADLAALPCFARSPRHFLRSLLVVGGDDDVVAELRLVDYTSAEPRAERRCVTIALVRSRVLNLEQLVDLTSGAAVAAQPAPVGEALAQARPLMAQARGAWIAVFPADGRSIGDDQLEAFAERALALHTALVASR